MSYAYHYRKLVRRIKDKQRKKLPLKKWELKRLEYDKQMDGQQFKMWSYSGLLTRPFAPNSCRAMDCSVPGPAQMMQSRYGRTLVNP